MNRLRLFSALVIVGVFTQSAPSLAAGAVGGVAAHADAEDGPPKWYGLSLDVSLSDSSDLNLYNYANSGYLLLEPSWSIGRMFLRNTPFKRLSLNGRWGLNRDFAGYSSSAISPNSTHGLPTTCSNLTPNDQGIVQVNDQNVQRCSYPNTYQFEPGDFSLTLTDPGIYKIPVVDIAINPSIRYTIPLSYQNQYAQMMAILQASLGVSRKFFGEKLSVGYSFGISKYFSKATAPMISDNAPDLTGFVTAQYSDQQVQANDAAFYANLSSPSRYDANYAISEVFSVNYNPLEQLHISVLYILTDTFFYGGSCGNMNFYGVTTNPCTNANAVAQSNGWTGTSGAPISDTQIFWASAAYSFYDWFAVYMSWVNASPLRAPNNAVYQPFISTNYNAFTNISLGVTFTVGANQG